MCRYTVMPTFVGAITGTCRIKFFSGFAGRQGENTLAQARGSRTRFTSRRLARRSSWRPTATSFGNRDFSSAGEADLALLPGGVGRFEIGQLSDNLSRSASRHASRSLIFVFSTPIWSNIVGVVAPRSAVPAVKRPRDPSVSFAGREQTHGHSDAAFGASRFRRARRRRRFGVASCCQCRWRWRLKVL